MCENTQKGTSSHDKTEDAVRPREMTDPIVDIKGEAGSRKALGVLDAMFDALDTSKVLYPDSRRHRKPLSGMHVQLHVSVHVSVSVCMCYGTSQHGALALSPSRSMVRSHSHPHAAW